jgi:hypothetical protein
VEQIKIQIKEQGFFSSYVKIIFFIEYLQIRMNQQIQDGYHINSEMMVLLICLVFCVVMLPVSLDCPFLIVPSVFSNVYIDMY